MKWNEESLLNQNRIRPSRVEKLNSDGRNAFENDYNRIILSSSFRRLQDKAQVFPLDQSDFVRTRLTHSIEVSSIASSMGASIEKFLLNKGEINTEDIGKIKGILSSVGLLHDMGNTPFGHFGEYAIKKFFTELFNNPENKDLFKELSEEEKKDFESFDGNAHILRLVTKLQYTRDIHGLNLTYATLASLLKYPRSSTEGNKSGNSIGVSYKKYGYFQSEKTTFNQIVEETKIKGKDGEVCRHPLVFIMEAADDIAYSVADIEDGIKKGILTIDKVKQILEKFLCYNDDGSRRHRSDHEEDILKILTKPIDDNYPNNDERTIQILRAKVQSFMIVSVVEKFKDEYDNIMKGRFDQELLNVCNARRVRMAFKEISTKIFDDKEVIQNELAGEKVITRLLELFVGCVINKNVDGDLLYNKNSKEGRLHKIISENYRYIYEEHSSKSLYDRLLLVTDYVCGMTDYFALDLYKKLNGIII